MINFLRNSCRNVFCDSFMYTCNVLGFFFRNLCKDSFKIFFWNSSKDSTKNFQAIYPEIPSEILTETSQMITPENLHRDSCWYVFKVFVMGFQKFLRGLLLSNSSRDSCVNFKGIQSGIF